MADGESYPVRTTDNNDIEKFSGVLTFTDSSDQPSPSSGGIVSGTAFAASGLTGAVTATRYAGGTATVAPTTGTFVAGDFVVSANGSSWVCTVGGTPGTWVEMNSVLLAAKASPTFTGVPAGPTAAADTNTTQLATTAYVVGNAYAKLAGPTFTGTVTVPAAAAATSATKLADLSSALTITSGALPNTGAWASGTAKQNPVARQITVNVAFVTNGTANAATCLIEISPDNSTYTAIGTLTASVGVNTAGAITLVCPVNLPNAWWIKLTFAQGAVAASVYY